MALTTREAPEESVSSEIAEIAGEDASGQGDEALREADAGSPAASPADALAEEAAPESATSEEVVFKVKDLNCYYGDYLAVKDVTMEIFAREITAMIGPSGCGKTTVLRCFNRMNDLVEGASAEGQLLFRGIDLYDSRVDPVEVRRRIGMVFQKPNPFPKSVYDNVAYGPKISKITKSKKALREVVESSLRQAALWDEVKDRLGDSAMGLSGGQQQRLCIARAIATNPDVLLMDEPCSALDPIATAYIEELMHNLKENYTIVIVTHNMQQAARISDRTAFFTAEVDAERQSRYGLLVEFDDTEKIFSNPNDERTENYITGRFG